jgi:hypothetical protein
MVFSYLEKSGLPGATTVKDNLKILIVIIGAVVLAAAFPILIWKVTSRSGADHLAGAGAGHYLSRKQVTFTGCATPEATLQSIVWAAIKGDSDKAFACLSPEAQADMNNKPNGRRKFNADIKRNGQQLNGLQIIARKTLAADKVELKFKLDAADPSNNGEHIPVFLIAPFVKIGGEWKLGGPDKEYTPDWDDGSQPEPGAS